MKRRVVVTGLGAITPLAIGVEPSWQSLCQGKSGIGALTRFDATGFRTRIAGEVNSFNPADFMVGFGGTNVTLILGQFPPK